MVGEIGGSVLGISRRVYKINRVMLASGGETMGIRERRGRGYKIHFALLCFLVLF